MPEPVDWNLLYTKRSAGRSSVLSLGEPLGSFNIPNAVVRRLAMPASEDLGWLTEALSDARRRWFVAELAERSKSISEGLFTPMLDAGIDEVDPSFNQYFVEPCVRVFGARRVYDYLWSVVESGTDARKAGALCALYWVDVSDHNCPSWGVVETASDLEAALRERRKRMLLETFLSDASVDLRRVLVRRMSLDPADYPANDQALLARVIRAVRSSEDEFIRTRGVVQHGSVTLYAPLPHRTKEERPTSGASLAPGSWAARSQMALKWLREWL